MPKKILDGSYVTPELLRQQRKQAVRRRIRRAIILALVGIAFVFALKEVIRKTELREMASSWATNLAVSNLKTGEDQPVTPPLEISDLITENINLLEDLPPMEAVGLDTVDIYADLDDILPEDTADTWQEPLYDDAAPPEEALHPSVTGKQSAKQQVLQLFAPTLGGGALPGGLEEIAAELLKETEFVVGILEASLPMFVDVFLTQIFKYMNLIERSEVTRWYTEEEFQKQVVPLVQRQFDGMLTHVQIIIEPESIGGRGQVDIDGVNMPLHVKMGLYLQQQRIQVLLQAVEMGQMQVPEEALARVTNLVNAQLMQSNNSVGIRQIHLSRGAMMIETVAE